MHLLFVVLVNFDFIKLNGLFRMVSVLLECIMLLRISIAFIHVRKNSLWSLKSIVFIHRCCSHIILIITLPYFLCLCIFVELNYIFIPNIKLEVVVIVWLLTIVVIYLVLGIVTSLSCKGVAENFLILFRFIS